VETKLFLKVNRDKSYVAHISRDVKYLGYGFYRVKGELRFRLHPKSKEALEDKVREILSRSNGWSYDKRRKRLAELIRGWVGYFRLADMKDKLEDIDGWMRRRIRSVYWRNWKRVRTKYAALRRLGIGHDEARKWSCSQKGYWRISKSNVLNVALNNAKLSELGWPSFTGLYLQVRVR